MLRGIKNAFLFLTILPLPFLKDTGCTEEEVGKSTAYFPLVGLIKGILIYWLYLIFRGLYPAEVVAMLLLIAYVAMNGAFHLDGLSDTFDALASRKDRDSCLRIMKDSTSGPIGSVSIILDLLLKAVLFYVAVKTNRAESLIVFSVAGAWSMVVSMYYGRSARDKGLGYLFIKYTGRQEYYISTAIMLLSVVFMAAFFRGLASVLVCLLSALALTALFTRRFGGLTGDTLGAVAEINELIFLLFYLL